MRSSLFLLLSLSSLASAGYLCANGGVLDATGTQCLQFFSTPTQLGPAEQTCEDLEGHTSSVHNAFQNNIIANRARNYSLPGFWLGATRQIEPLGWTWFDATKMNYTNWDTGEPADNDKLNCIFMDGVSGKWKAALCQEQHPFVCQVDPVIIGCDNGWTRYTPTGLDKDAYCLKVIVNLTDFNDAVSRCAGEGAGLVSIHSEQEMNYLQAAGEQGSLTPIQSSSCTWTDGTWIGLRATTQITQFTWTDGSQLNYQNWMPQHPVPVNKDKCVMMFSTHAEGYPLGQWYDTDCSCPMRNTICKKNVQTKSVKQRNSLRT